MNDKRGTGGQPWPLKSTSNGGENPSFALPGSTQFEFQDVPDRCPTGPLAYYLLGVMLVITGLYTPAVEGGAAINRQQLPGILIDSINWTNSWLGAVLSNAFVKGSWLPIIEFTAGGFQYGQRQQNNLAATGAQTFRISIALPALNDARGRNIRETSHLAMLFQPSHLKIQWADGANLTAAAPGATMTNLNCRATAILQPRPEIVAATPMEWVTHQTSLAGSTVKIPGFGRDSGLVGMQPKGGVSFLAELTSRNFMGGIVLPTGVDSLQFQWRGLGLLEDVHTWVNQFIDLLPNSRPQQTPDVDQGTASTVNDFNNFPFIEQVPAQNSDIDLTGLLFFPFAMGGDDMQLTDLQTADTDQSYYLNGSGAFEQSGSGEHQILAQYARQYQGQKLQDFVAAVTSGNDPLAKFVYGPDYVKYQMRPRFPRDKHSVSADQAAYVAFLLAP